MDVLQAFVAGGACTALVTGVFKVVEWLLNRKATKEDRQDEKQSNDFEKLNADLTEVKRVLNVLIVADRTILYNEIKRLGKYYIERKYVTIEELEDLQRMHQVYHDSNMLCGNGFLDGLMSDVNKLPKRS